MSAGVKKSEIPGIRRKGQDQMFGNEKSNVAWKISTSIVTRKGLQNDGFKTIPREKNPTD